MGSATPAGGGGGAGGAGILPGNPVGTAPSNGPKS